MTISFKSAAYHITIALAVFFIGFVLSSGMVYDVSNMFSDKIMPSVQCRLHHHILTLQLDAKKYFLLPVGAYEIGLYTQPLSFAVLGSILINSVFNILFQPVFLCLFTPQVIVNAVLLPFFLYGVVRYFRKVWFMLLLFLILSFWVGVYDSGVEALMRHGMPCELIYLLIGVAGFTGWTTRN